MDRTALGIALIPEEKVQQLLVSWNDGLADEGIVLSVNGPIPHITLTMIHIADSHRVKLQQEVNDLAQSLRLRATGISMQTSSTGKSLLWLDIELSSELRILHEEAMKLRKKYHISRVTAEAFFRQTASKGSIHYVEHFERYGNHNYEPHLTIGYGNEVFQVEPFEFNSRLAIGQLGDGCVFWG